MRHLRAGSRIELSGIEQGGRFLGQVLERLDLGEPCVLVTLEPQLSQREIDYYCNKREPERGKTPLVRDRALLVERRTHRWPWNLVFDVPWRADMFLVPASLVRIDDLGQLFLWGSFAVKETP